MKKAIFVVLATVMLVGCGRVVEIPPATVAKLSTPSGLSSEIINAGKIRLSDLCITCDSIVLLEASDIGVKETMTLFIPKDKLNLQVDVRGTMSLANDPATINNVFSRITPKAIDDRVSIIGISRVYSTYAAPVVRTAVRSVLTKHGIMDIMANREALSSEMATQIKEKLRGTPITVLRMELADLQPPAVIVTAQEKAKEREIAIREAEANKLVALKEAEAALEVAIKQQEVDLKEAETQVLVNKKLAEGVNKAFVIQRSLKVLEKMSNSNNKTFFLPQESFTNPALLLGAVREASSNGK